MIKTKKRIEMAVEKKIVIGMIVSSEYMHEVLPLINFDFFHNKYTRILAKWACNYYETYGKAMFKDAEDVFLNRQHSIDPGDADLIEKLLVELSKRYEIDPKINVNYLLDYTIEYFTVREMEIRINNVQVLLDKGQVEDAKEQMLMFNTPERLISEWGDPFRSENLLSVFQRNDSSFFQFPGDLGEFLGEMNPGWLIGITGAFKRGKCLSEDSKVLLSDGKYLPVKEIVRKKLTNIVSFDEGSQKFVKSKITNFYNNGKKTVYKIKTRTGRSVQVTKNHPLLSIDGWKTIGDLTVDDIIAVPKKLDFFGNLEIEDYKIKFLAYILAEGGMTTGSLVFTKIDKNTRNDFISSVQRFGDSVTATDGINEIRVTNNYQIPNCKIWLKHLGLFGKKSNNKFIPEFVFELPKQKLSLFLSVLFSCDGSIYKSGDKTEIEYSSSSRELLYSVHHLLIRFGIISKIRKKIVGGNPYWNLVVRDRKNLLKFYKHIGFYIEKSEKLEFLSEEIKNRPKNRGLIDLFYKPDSVLSVLMCYPKTSRYRVLSRNAKKKNGGISTGVLKEAYNVTGDYYLKVLSESEILWDKVHAIEYIGKKQTYDLTVQKYHNFVADDILVHNTFFLIEFAVVGVLLGLSVAFFSLEMPLTDIYDRIYKRISGGTVDGFVFPCFDCYFNQEDTCTKTQRTNNRRLLNAAGEKPQYSSNIRYKPCTWCRHNSPDEYKMATWFEEIPVDKYDFTVAKKYTKLFEKHYGNRLRVRAYPKFSANVRDMERDLNILYQRENFLPNLIIVDHADILRGENNDIVGVEKEDTTWMSLGRMAGERNALVVTGTQATRQALDVANLKTRHTARWIGKLGHVDMMMTLNQSEKEKKEGVMRVGIMEHRHKHFFETETVTVLQKLSAGQVHLDSVK